MLFTSNIIYSQAWQKQMIKENGEKEVNFYEIQKSFNDYWKPLNVKNGKYLKDGKLVKAPGWKLFKRWEWYWEARIDQSTGQFPKTSTAIEFEKFMQSSTQLKSTNGNWESLGPISSRGGYAGIGRINCISFHPADANTFWVGAPSGGLWTTTDGGTNWEVLTDENSVLGVSDIAIPSDYASSNTIYIATGDRDASDNNSIGVLKSTDNGLNWEGILSTRKDARLLSAKIDSEGLL